jgi:hypothetical protein
MTDNKDRIFLLFILPKNPFQLIMQQSHLHFGPLQQGQEAHRRK